MSQTISQDKISKNKTALEVMLPDTRGVSISRYGKGNLKIGLNVVTYSKQAVAACPGATPWCKQNCYAVRIAQPVLGVHVANTEAGADVPDLPEGSKLVRIHVAGDFDSVAYVERWIAIVAANPAVNFWAYTRSWRVAELMPHLDRLRALPNIQLFASVDESTGDLPPEGWRVAWIEGDPRIPQKALVCPEERGKVRDCEQCGFCIYPPIRKDVVFLRH